ncbi:phosphotransferase family protein [Pseudonocardia alaniniphila]|uniref:Aminoglycoside phosphotransferase family protein n=1 Tax=Pseudonocardia alaniniphila TaxID=75291 RepID=A0ABS9T9F0_9PSEU|nr:aminoglycoside phosphotransferase family protein [Pseudonocardia alaniniphila]MCH6165160.1 aminoglycoside phosphotransferase family protein [Pseudonocardia alaniniphila]
MDLGEAVGRRSLEEACRRVGVDARSVELIRVGTNAVFRVGRDVIGRVVLDEGNGPSVERQVAVARWLESVGFPANRALAVDQPVKADGLLVTLWESVCDGEVYAPIADVAAVIKQLHELRSPTGIDLPDLRPFGAETDPLPGFPGLDENDATFLRSRIERARLEFGNLPFALPLGVIHGDANVGNVLSGKEGRPVVIDLDSFAVGPREWDLIQTAIFYDRFGWHTAEEYRTFVDVYGYDIMTWPGYSDLADMREVAMVTWLSRKATESGGAAAEAKKRINAMRTGGSRRDWGPY